MHNYKHPHPSSIVSQPEEGKMMGLSSPQKQQWAMSGIKSMNIPPSKGLVQSKNLD